MSTGSLSPTTYPTDVITIRCDRDVIDALSNAVTDEIDIYRAAKLYVDQHGDQAALQAAMRSDELLAAGAMDGAAMWRKQEACQELSPWPPMLAGLSSPWIGSFVRRKFGAIPTRMR